MIFDLLVTILAAYGAHFSYRLTSRLGNGWSQLSAYTLGVLFAFPFVLKIHSHLSDIKSPAKRLTTAYFLAYLFFGVGTVTGWILHPMQGPSIFMDDSGG